MQTSHEFKSEVLVAGALNRKIAWSSTLGGQVMRVVQCLLSPEEREEAAGQLTMSDVEEAVEEAAEEEVPQGRARPKIKRSGPWEFKDGALCNSFACGADVAPEDDVAPDEKKDVASQPLDDVAPKDDDADDPPNAQAEVTFEWQQGLLCKLPAARGSEEKR